MKTVKIQLGDVTINTSAEEALKAKIALLTAELESTKFELATAQKWIADYQAIAKSQRKAASRSNYGIDKVQGQNYSNVEKATTVRNNHNVRQ